MDLNKYHYYINLDSRPDRRFVCEEELKKIGIDKPNRFPAIKTKQGIVGCGMSHLQVIMNAKKQNYPYVAIFEDDVLFKDPQETLEKINRLYMHEWDVLMLSGNSFKPYTPYNEDAIQVKRCYTTGAYIVRKHFYDKLIENLNTGLKLLITTQNRNNYSLDVYWMKLQQEFKFFLIRPLKVIQRPGHSDIENEKVNYTNLMETYEK